jgi:hypothetical protein
MIVFLAKGLYAIGFFAFCDNHCHLRTFDAIGLYEHDVPLPMNRNRNPTIEDKEEGLRLKLFLKF